MSINALIEHTIDKGNFLSVQAFLEYTIRFLEYIDSNLQARIISQNENHYEFLQYREEGSFNISRPINSRLMYNAEEFSLVMNTFPAILQRIQDRELPSDAHRTELTRTIYTIQQSIGAALDALPAGKANQARKINGERFERFIKVLINSLGIDCVGGTIKVPVKDNAGNTLFTSSYQHDLMISNNDELRIIGSVKTSSKDRIDKVFVDKFLYNRLTETNTPHIAIFLNDVQRKNTKQENKYGISSTFLPGHFKAYTFKLNPLDGVYYCDIRPNMLADELLSQSIKTIDHFFFNDVWELLNREGVDLSDVSIQTE
ncbi:hypothetical protein [Serratia ureilytica]|uniref:hypothetical protein n=1 Tax=Serratia ureilytica TaxID=300181 RepID=UPI00313BC542